MDTGQQETTLQTAPLDADEENRRFVQNVGLDRDSAPILDATYDLPGPQKRSE